MVTGAGGTPPGVCRPLSDEDEQETRLALRDLAGARRASRTVVRLCWASAMSSMSFLAMIAMCAQGYSSVR